MKKINISRKTRNILLGLCICTAVLMIGAGLMKYLHTIDIHTLGRRVYVYGLKVSGLTEQEAAKKISDTFHNRRISFQEQGKEIKSVSLRELGYTLDENFLKAQLNTLKQQRDQERKLFPPRRDYRILYRINKDKAREKEVLNSDNFNNVERMASVDAAIRYDEEKMAFILIKEVQGNQIDDAKLQKYTDKILEKQFKDNLLNGEVKIDLGIQVYRQPAEKASVIMENRLAQMNDRLEKYRTTTVTYTFGETRETLDQETISSWIRTDNGEVSIDRQAAASYIQNLADQYNTMYIPRTFRTSYGTDVTISNNEYGYRIDEEKELNQLLSDLQTGTDIVREPVYSRTAMKRNGKDDLEGSYIEVSLDAQHLWLYRDGTLVTETDIISGSPTQERETLRGAWPIAYKASPFTLTSEQYQYETKVKYWMPFVYGQGLHDASWQPAFGGDRYRTGMGSHGCINLPEDKAEVIYNTIDGGYPIIIY